MRNMVTHLGVKMDKTRLQRKNAHFGASSLRRCGAAGEARTRNPRLRRPVLFPIELPRHGSFLVL